MVHTLTPQFQRIGHPQDGPINGYPAPYPAGGYWPETRLPAPPAPPGPWGATNGWRAQPEWPVNPAGGGGRQRLFAIGGAAAVTMAAMLAVVGLTSGGVRDSHVSASGGVHVPTPPVRSDPAPQTTAPARPPSASGIEDSTLPALLPPIADVARVTGAASLEPIDKLNGPGMFSDEANPAQCVGVVMGAAKVAYAGSGVRATYIQALHEQDPTKLHTTFNAVSTFDSESATAEFLNGQLAIWKGCQSAPIVLDPNDEKPMTWTVRDVAVHGDNLTADISLRGGQVACQRALTGRRNVVIDITSCSASPADTAATLASAIADRVGQRA